MEPWLDKREITSRKGALMLSKQSESTLEALSVLVNYSYRTRRDKIFKQETLSALPYFRSMVTAIYGAKNAYRYYCGQKLEKEVLAVSVHTNPDMILGLKEPLLRYAHALPTIIEATPDFLKGEEYGLFLFCYRTLIFVLEELLLAVSGSDIREPLLALYDLDAAFEHIKVQIIQYASNPTNNNLQKKTARKEFVAGAERCIGVLRQVSREFYVLEMSILKLRAKMSNMRSNEPMQRFSKLDEPCVNITQESVASFMHSIFGDNDQLLKT